MSTLVENVQKVKNAHAALKTAIAAKGVDVPDGTKLTDMPALVEQIPSAPAYTSATNFYEGSGKASIDVPATVFVDFAKATSLYRCFAECSALTTPTFPAGFGQNAENVGQCFIRCNSLTSLTLPAGFGQAATNIAGCFYKCIKLTSLNLPAGFGKAATTTSRCFQDCSALTEITGNPNFKVSLILSNCTNLTHDSIMVVINGLQTVTTTQTLTLGSTNLAKLTDAEKQIAIDKGWTLA